MCVWWGAIHLCTCAWMGTLWLLEHSRGSSRRCAWAQQRPSLPTWSRDPIAPSSRSSTGPASGRGSPGRQPVRRPELLRSQASLDRCWEPVTAAGSCLGEVLGRTRESRQPVGPQRQRHPAAHRSLPSPKAVVRQQLQLRVHLRKDWPGRHNRQQPKTNAQPDLLEVSLWQPYAMRTTAAAHAGPLGAVRPSPSLPPAGTWPG